MITWLESLPQVTLVPFSGQRKPTNNLNLLLSFNALCNIDVKEIFMSNTSKHVKLSKYDYQIKHKDGYTNLHRHGNIKVRINIKHLHLNSSFNRQM